MEKVTQIFIVNTRNADYQEIVEIKKILQGLQRRNAGTNIPPIQQHPLIEWANKGKVIALILAPQGKVTEILQKIPVDEQEI